VINDRMKIHDKILVKGHGKASVCDKKKKASPKIENRDDKIYVLV